MKRILFLIMAGTFTASSFSQTISDTTKTRALSPITIQGAQPNQDIERLDSIQGTYIFSGKKNEVIYLAQKNIAQTEKYGRQIFAKVPGVFVYDMDGTGNQMNISTRGLDPHRGWEFNIRKDGIITNSDMYGYPASHYNIPMEAVDRIELVRGTGSLQYGAQFGGMLNYVSKKPDSTKQFAFESINTVGSYGLVSTFNSASGKTGKLRYMAWVNKKWITGYRDDSESKYDAEAVSLFYDAAKNLHFKLEWNHSNYLTQLPGPLTDAMFQANPQMATRSRNYYSPDIHVPSLAMDWKIGPMTQLELTTSAVLGSRKSVLFDKPATTEDVIVPATLQHANRQVDIDHYNSYTTELRVLHSYKLLEQTSTLTAGVQYMNNKLHRQQQGKGTTGSNYDLTLVTPGWGRDLYFKTGNMAFFAENRWLLAKGFSVNTGARMEIGETDMTGVTTYYPAAALPNTIRHQFPLFGASAQYDITKDMNFYGGWSQAYRPVLFKDIIPASVYESSDKNLKDAYGSNTELGFRGKWKFLQWDVTGFHLRYNKRMGTLAGTDGNGNLTVFRTNIGDSQTNGVELFLQGDYPLGKRLAISLFTSTSFMEAKYRKATLRSGNTNVDIDGREVESVPACMSRNGFTFRYDTVSFSALYSYTDKSFADALNTIEPSVNGAVGIVPSYQLVDLNLAFQITDKIKLQLNGNNIFNAHYFTKRPQFYPGPGIWPSDGRTFSGTVSVKL